MSKTAKLGIRLNKMLKPKSINKRFPYVDRGDETNILPSLKKLTKTDGEPCKRGIRRLAMLNKLFMKHITDIMSTGTVSMKLVGRGIEISKVNVSQDYKFVSVFYIDKSLYAEDDTEITLSSIAGQLRHELTILQLMGNVPRVVFVKDRQESLAADVNRLLAIADYGEDYIPQQPAQVTKTELISNMKLTPDIKVKIKQLEESEPVEDEPIPDMTNNVYGLDHQKIMKRLLACRKKNRDAWDKLQIPNSNLISYRTSGVKGPPVDLNEQKKELADFLLKRQISRKEASRQWRSAGVQQHANSFATKEEEPTERYDKDEYMQEKEYIEEEMRKYEEELANSKDEYGEREK